MTHDLIVFAEDWGGLPSSTQHLLKHLAKTRKVVWVNSIGLRQPTFSLNDMKRLWHKLLASQLHAAPKFHASPIAETAHTPEASNFHIINPLTLPAPRSPLARYIAQKLLQLQLSLVLKKANLHAPILWASLPTAVDIAGHLGEVALVYYCGDDFSGLAGVDHHTIARREQELCDKANLIMVASRALATKMPKHKTALLTHGVDYDLFSTPCKRAPDLPNDGRQIAGFYGSISAWLDIPLLHEVIQKMPHWHFIFIGKVSVDVSSLVALDNVIFLGERTHQQLPSYSQHWSASLLPFIDNAQIRACNPLKLTEYLAAGRPIISTPFPAIKPFRGIVQTASTGDAMIEALLNSEHLQSLHYFPNALRSTVAHQSWASRAQQVSTWLDTL